MPESYFVPPGGDTPTDPPRRALHVELQRLSGKQALIAEPNSPLDHAIRAFAVDARVRGDSWARVTTSLEWCLEQVTRDQTLSAAEKDALLARCLEWALDAYWT